MIANASLDEEAMESGALWAHPVTTIPGFEIAKIEEQVAETLGHAVDLADPDILQFALSVGVLRGGIEVARGRIPISDLPAWLIMDGASRGLLLFVGGNAGAWFGLIAIGPAGALILGPAIGAAALLGNNNLKGYAQKQLMANWHEDLLRAAGKLHGRIISAIERRIVHLEERSRTFASNASQSDLDTWMAMRTQDDLIAALEDRPSLITSRPRAEVDAIRLLFSAREIAPTDADVLSRVHEVEQAMARKPGLKTVMIEAWHRLLLPRIGELRPDKVFEDVALRRRTQEFALEPTDPGRTFSVTGRRLCELLLSGQVLDPAEALGTSPTG